MLKALVRWLWPREAPPTSPGHSPGFVTHAELDAIIAKFEQRTEFELGEWFDKFSALHARTEKRVQRDRTNKGNGTVQVEEPPRATSVLAYRKPWSV